jgi:hypothetical protein
MQRCWQVTEDHLSRYFNFKLAMASS